MSNPIIKAVIRSKFLLTSHEQASRVIRRNADAYLKLARQVGDESGSKPVLVPSMVGIDPEMRNWSLFQILDHNAIVNRSIAATVEALALGRELSGAALINPKTDVLPKGLSGSEQVESFRSSVDDYLCRVATLTELRGTAETPHPIFGPFDAHKWHCMFGFHLGLHLKQAEKVLSLQRS
jgi:hypothetical protein